MIYRFGDTSVDTLRAEIRQAGEIISLRRKSFDVLVYLLQRPRRVVTKDELLDAIWGDRIVTEGSIKHCLMEVRSAIGDHHRKLIRTIPRRGYMLEAPVTRETAEADRRTSILVAPINEQGSNGDGTYIADGLTEEIITELSKVRSLRVIARASAMRLKGLGNALRRSARELGVDFILDGSVHIWGDKLRVVLQLRQLDADDTRWSERYSGTLGDLFEIQDKIAQSVAEELAMHLVGPRTNNDGAPEDPRALESYLRARYETLKFSQNGLVQAEQHLLNGLELVGPNARLLCALGHAYARHCELGFDVTGEFIGKAAECAEKVFELDPQSPLGYLLLGMVRFHSGDLRAARGPLERSLHTNPADPDALLMLGYVYALSGQHQRALQLFDALIDVDPLTPINHCMPGFVAVLDGRYADALPHYKRFLDLDPHNAFAIWTFCYVLLRNDRIEEASEAAAKLNTDYPGTLLAQLGTALFNGVCGKPETALKVLTGDLRAAARHSEFLSRELTHCLALAGETEEALNWLENTVRIGNINYPFWSKHNEWISSLRTQSRFIALMTTVEKEWMSIVSDSDVH